jgi:ubiquinone/menaquinone biosynthesis C-methylase UbiE
LNLDVIGIDLVPFDPYVVFGDFHSIPFESKRFSFLFTNSFDHSLYPDKMIKEMCRITVPKGIIVLHVSLKAKTDAFGVTEVGNVKELLKFFENCQVLASKK